MWLHCCEGCAAYLQESGEQQRGWFGSRAQKREAAASCRRAQVLAAARRLDESKVLRSTRPKDVCHVALPQNQVRGRRASREGAVCFQTGAPKQGSRNAGEKGCCAQIEAIAEPCTPFPTSSSSTHGYDIPVGKETRCQAWKLSVRDATSTPPRDLARATVRRGGGVSGEVET